MISRILRGCLLAASAIAASTAHAQSPSYLQSTIGADAAIIYRDFNTNGVPVSGAYNPSKSDIRHLMSVIGTALGPGGMVTGTVSSAITTDGFISGVQNSSLTAETVQAGITGNDAYDAFRSTFYVPNGSTITGINGFGCYGRNENQNGGVAGNAVCYYGLITGSVTGANTWGQNLIVVDNEVNTGTPTAVAGIKLIGSEFDMSASNTLTVTVTAAAWASTAGGTATLTLASSQQIPVGTMFTVAGVTPTAYDGAFVAIAGTTGATLKYLLPLGSTPGSGTIFGTIATGTIIQGFAGLGSSIVQPYAADFITAGSLSVQSVGLAKWAHAFVVDDNAAVVAAYFGAQGATAGSPSSLLEFSYLNSSGVGHTMNVLANLDALSITGDGFRPNGIAFFSEPAGTSPIIAPTGSDTNLNLVLQGKGAAGVLVNSGSTFNAFATFVGGANIETTLNIPFVTPATSSSACTAGQHEVDASFIYTCTATNTWRRLAVGSTW